VRLDIKDSLKIFGL